MLRPLLALALAALAVSTVQGQGFGRLDNLEAKGAAYAYARAGEATTRVYVGGDVQAPGLYDVSTTIDMSGVLALAGGLGVRPADDQFVRQSWVRLYRIENGQRRLAFEAEMSVFLAQTTPPPTLKDGDVIEVYTQQRRRYGWRDNVVLVGAATGLLTIVLQVIALATAN